MLSVYWCLNITASRNQQNVRAVSCTKMSCKCLLFFLIISQVRVAHPSKDQNASINGCVRFNWIEDFFARQRQSEWNYTVKDILQDCLSDYSKVNETTGCNGPIVNVTFPLFSCPSNFTLLEAEFYPLVAIKEESFSIGRQILHAFKQIWELIVICIIGAMLSGIIIWFLVSIQKPLFPHFIPLEKLIIQMIYVTQVRAKSTIKNRELFTRIIFLFIIIIYVLCNMQENIDNMFFMGVTVRCETAISA